MAIVIETFVLGPLETNCYVLRSGDVCWIIDPGMGVWPLLESLRESRLTPQRVLLTHGHGDHIAGCDALRKEWPELKLAIHPADAAMLTDAELNVSALFGIPFTVAPAEEMLEFGQTLEFCGAAIHVLQTDGHTPGGVSFYVPSIKAVFTGDALLEGSIGRTDTRFGNHDQLISTIRANLLTLPEDTRVFSGHGDMTTIGREKAENPYVGEAAK